MATLYAGGRVFDGEKVLDGHAVLEEDGRVKRVASAAEFAGFSGDKVDTAGGTLIPGIIDCHVHSLSGAEGNPGAVQDRMSAAQIAVRGMELMRSTLEGGVTAVRDCGGKDYIEFALRDAFNSGRFLGPTMRCAGRMICMTGGHGNRTGRVADGIDELLMFGADAPFVLRLLAACEHGREVGTALDQRVGAGLCRARSHRFAHIVNALA